MQKHGDAYRGQIPCDATENSGTLRVWVRAKDAQGEQVDSWGSKQAPIEFAIAEGVKEPPPTFDDGQPPARCQAKEECPPDFPGCGGAKGAARGGKDWGEQCNNSTECKSGLLCTDGTCQAAPSCESDADCTTGKCMGGKCDLPEGAASSGPSTFKKNWIGLNIAQDIAFVGGYNVCDPSLGQASDNYACFYQGTTDEPFFHTPYPLRDGINNGTVLATTRILLSYDRGFTPQISAGARVGFALGGGPPAGQSPAGNTKDPPAHAKGTGGTAFLPVHVEIRGQFWFLPMNAKLFRAYALVGGGMAQVDAKVKINEYDCENAGKDPQGRDVSSMGSPDYNMDSPYYIPNYPDANGASPYQQCKSGKKTYYNIKHQTPVPVDGWRKMGQGFVEAGLGGMLAFKDNMGLTLEAKILYMLPASGVVIEPSLGYQLGF
jgi:hypothetical protein